jgi:hypothetical protein
MAEMRDRAVIGVYVMPVKVVESVHLQKLCEMPDNVKKLAADLAGQVPCIRGRAGPALKGGRLNRPYFDVSTEGQEEIDDRIKKKIS